MGAQQSHPSRKLNFPAGSVETDPFFETTVKVRDFVTATITCDRLSFMIEPDSTSWFLCKRFVDWNTPTQRHVGTLGYRVKDVFVRDDNLYIVTDRKRYTNSSVDQQHVFVYKKQNDNKVVDQDNDVLNVLTESLANPVKHPFLDIFHGFLVKKEEVKETFIKERHGTLPPTKTGRVRLAIKGTLSKFTLNGVEPNSEVAFLVNGSLHSKGVANEAGLAHLDVKLVTDGVSVNLDRIDAPHVQFKPSDKPITYQFDA